MPINLGTRTKANLKYERWEQGYNTRSNTRDLHMSKLVSASLTFTSATARVSGANGSFPAAGFQLNDPILVALSNRNNGYFTITGLDAANQSFLTLDPPPKDEGPVAVTIRTP